MLSWAHAGLAISTSPADCAENRCHLAYLQKLQTLMDSYYVASVTQASDMDETWAVVAVLALTLYGVQMQASTSVVAWSEAWSALILDMDAAAISNHPTARELVGLAETDV